MFRGPYVAWEGRLQRAKKLRRSSSLGERILWDQLRCHQFQGRKCRRQVPIGPFIADFIIPSARLIIEVDGPHHAETKEYDRNRDHFLCARGFSVLRVSDAHVIEDCDEVLNKIAKHIQKYPLSDSLPAGREDYKENYFIPRGGEGTF